MTISIFGKIYNGKWDRDALDYLELIDQWHVVARSEDVRFDKPVSAKLMGEKIVLWRSDNRKINVWKDFCAHRGYFHVCDVLQRS